MRLIGQNSHEALYDVNEGGLEGKIRVFQFEFTGNVTLSLTNEGNSQNVAAIQALFFD